MGLITQKGFAIGLVCDKTSARPVSVPKQLILVGIEIGNHSLHGWFEIDQLVELYNMGLPISDSKGKQYKKEDDLLKNI